MKKKNEQSFAFTLAEVLITLGIIGIVAAMTIPTIINNSNKMKYITALKKSYTTWNQALAKMAVDSGTPEDITSLFTGTTDSIGDNIASYFNVVQNCKSVVSAGCFTNKAILSYNGTGASWDLDGFAYYKFITADGAAYMFLPISNCTTNESSNITGDLTKICATFYVDVNGKKAPNTFGRDIFRFNLSNGRTPMLYPFGGVDSNNATNKAYCHGANTTGFSCSSRIMEDGWQMEY